QIDAHDLDLNAVTQTETATTALAGQTVLDRIEVVVITRQRRDMNQTLDVDILELHEQAETGRRSHHTRIDLADAILHELALEPVDHVARCLVGAAFGLRAGNTQL